MFTFIICFQGDEKYVTHIISLLSLIEHHKLDILKPILQMKEVRLRDLHNSCRVTQRVVAEVIQNPMCLAPEPTTA